MTRFFDGCSRIAGLAALIAAILATAPVHAAAEPADSAMVLRGGQDGTVFQSLTIEGEDRIHVEFDRPTLDLEVDPSQAPGLERDDLPQVLGRGGYELLPPLLRESAFLRTKRLARPWLSRFLSGDIVRFQPAVDGVESWRLSVADSRGATVATFQSDKKPPDEITWNGLDPDGNPVSPGLTYSYVFEALDRAGNKRNFVGEGLELPPYRCETEEKLFLLFSGEELRKVSVVVGAPPQVPILMEAADWVNRYGRMDSPVQVNVGARTFDQAKSLADELVAGLIPLLVGDPLRIQPVTDVQPTAAAGGMVTISALR